MKRATILLFYLLFTSTLTAQQAKGSFTLTPALVEAPNIRYGLQMGGAYQLGPKLQLLTEITMATGKPDDPTILNSRYTRIKPEIRYLFSELQAPVRGYVGLQASYANRRWTNSGSGSYFEQKFYSDSVIRFSSATIHSPFAALTSQFGAIARLGKHISLDFFLGMGAKGVFTAYSDVTAPEKVWSQTAKCRIMFRPDPAWWLNATLIRFQMNMGIRVITTF